MSLSPTEFLVKVLKNPFNQALLDILQRLDLPQGMLTAGCLFLSVWNGRSGAPPQHGIKDYDVFYFDGSDLSWEAENEVIRRAKPMIEGLGAKVDIKNQARVHLWYRARFGTHYPQLSSARAGVDPYLVACTRVGLDLRSHEIYAPDDLDDLWNGVLRMNPLNAQPDPFEQKCRDYRSRWPWLTVRHG